MCRSPLMAIAFLPAFIGFSSFRRDGGMLRLYIVLFAVYLISRLRLFLREKYQAPVLVGEFWLDFFSVCTPVPPRERSSG